MVQLSAYEALPVFDQLMHGLHFMLCAFACLIACIPLLTPKGSVEHKFGGMIYLPVSAAALLLASTIAWHEASLVLFCFNSFCAYLLLSGWRAVHEKEKPQMVDWIIPGALFALSLGVTLHALIYDEGKPSFFLLFFALNGFYLSARDWAHLRRRTQAFRNKIFLVLDERLPGAMEWLNRHVAGMVGSLLANLSVVVLTLLPLSLHWLWPATLITAAAFVGWRQREKKRRVNEAIAAILQPKFRKESYSRPKDDDIRRAA